MVSSVFVELMGDDCISSTLSGESGEAGKSSGSWDIALGVGEEDIFGVKVKAVTWGVHAAGSEGHTLKIGDWGTPPNLL